jgi:hypothetical protein
MSGSKKIDPTETYVLEETAITKTCTIEELAELAIGPAKARETVREEDHRPKNDSRSDDLGDWTELLD